jgi:hypothetical protein
VRQSAHLAVQGNHDREIAQDGNTPPNWIGPQYWPVTLWTRRVLTDQNRQAMQSWPEVTDEGNQPYQCRFWHSSLLGRDELIDRSSVAQRHLEQLLEQDTAFGFFGHTHIQCYYRDGIDATEFHLACTADETAWLEDRPRSSNCHIAPVGTWHPLPSQWTKIIFNPGSVGALRQHNLLSGSDISSCAQAAYMLVHLTDEGRHPGRFRFQRLFYNGQEVADMMHQRMRWSPTFDGYELPPEGSPGRDRLITVLTNIEVMLPELRDNLIRKYYCSNFNDL